jgi:cob(I)alamin adenosyltransferase
MGRKKKDISSVELNLTEEEVNAAIERANKKLKHQTLEQKLKSIQKSLLNVGIKSSVHLTHLGRVVIKTNIFSDTSENYFLDADRIPQN